MTTVKIAFGSGFPRSNNVGCDRTSPSYSAEATTPQTVAVSPICPLASSGLRGAAAAVEEAHNPKTIDATTRLAVLILAPHRSSVEPSPLVKVFRIYVVSSLQKHMQCYSPHFQEIFLLCGIDAMRAQERIQADMCYDNTIVL